MDDLDLTRAYRIGAKLAALEYYGKYTRRKATPKTANDKFEAKIQKIIQGHIRPIKNNLREATRRIEKDMPKTTSTSPTKKVQVKTPTKL